MTHIFWIVLQWVSGFFLGAVGLILMGDFSAWWREHRESRPDLAGLIMLLLYLGALAVIRFAPHGL